MRVLIGLDDSPVSARAARVATDLFTQPDAEFFVVNVATLPAPWVGAAGFGVVAPLPPFDPAAFGPDESSESDLMALAEELGVDDAEPIVGSGDPVTAICSAADAHDVDVIVVGSHDKSALRRIFDPSVAAGVVRDTHRPVLVVSGVPPHGESGQVRRTGSGRPEGSV
jgi:nucleotide-binding universal stress UspA family protein